MMISLFASPFRLVSALALVWVCGAAAAETNQAQPVSGRLDETNAQEILRAYLQVQEQLHANQLAIEQSRKEAKEAAAQHAELLSDRLLTIEHALGSQRARELEAMQSSNRVLLIVAGAFGGVGFLAMLLMAYFQWRTVHGLTEIAAALPSVRAFGAGAAVATLPPGETHLVTVGPVEQSNLRLLGALEQLEKRISELERPTLAPALHESTPDGDGERSAESSQGSKSSYGVSSIPPSDQVIANNGDRVQVLLGKGQSMLNLDKPEEALGCFEQVLGLEPENAEALVKKGIALERMQMLNEAIECYDRAISANESMTIAYLHKGGLFNRLERFDEALACYEQALRTQEKRHS